MPNPSAKIRQPPNDDALAWQLIAAVRSHLSKVEADQIHIAIGIGETFAAIDALITTIARHQVPLDGDLVTALAAWLDCYHGQNAEPRLRHLLAEITDCSPPQMSAFEQRFGSALISARDRRSG